MWPWGHLAVGYLAYSLWCRHRGRRPGAAEAALVAVGTQVPDLVDKPLAWTFGVLEAGRSLGHSVLIAAAALGLLAAVLAPRIGRPPVAAFAVGYLSHPLADLPFGDLLAGELADTTYLVWPLLPPPAYETEPSFIAHLLAYELGAAEAVQLGLFGVAALVWYRDGAPGWGAAREAAGRYVPRRAP